jgi:EAL domain-containing protein (putative c-di-GMP-specific phosphodiesterase class I)
MPLLWNNFLLDLMETPKGKMIVFVVFIFLTLFSTLAYFSNRYKYPGIAKTFERKLIGIFFVLTLVNWFVPETIRGHLFIALFVGALALSATIIGMLYHHHRKLSAVAGFYILSGIFLAFVLALSKDVWSVEILITVYFGCFIAILLGFAFFFMEYFVYIGSQHQEAICAKDRQIEEVEEKSFYLCHYDPITNLKNKEMCIKDLSAWAEAGSTSWLVLISLDNLSIVRNHLGYSKTDILLIKIACVLDEELSDSERLYFLNQDSFLCIHEMTKEELVGYCSMLSKNINAAVFSEFGNTKLAISFACTILDAHKSYEVLFRELHATLLQIQDEGNFRVGFFDDQYLVSLEQDLFIQGVLVKSVAQNEVEVWVQPKFDLLHGDIVGVEALARLQASGEPIPPSQFIPIAEKSNLIVEIGHQIVEKALRRYAESLKNYTLNINLSPVQLLDKKSIEGIISLTQTLQIAPEKVIFEITETALMLNYDLCISRLHELRGYGFGIALDDFGTGYSSFSYLMSIPATEIKIDRVLIEGIERDRKKQLILRALVNVSRDLEILLVVEGIETQGQLEMVKSLGCRYGQGYLLQRPMPFGDFFRS